MCMYETSNTVARFEIFIHFLCGSLYSFRETNAPGYDTWRPVNVFRPQKDGRRFSAITCTGKYETPGKSRRFSRQTWYANDAFNRAACLCSTLQHRPQLFCYTLHEFAVHVSWTFTRLAGLNTHFQKTVEINLSRLHDTVVRIKPSVSSGKYIQMYYSVFYCARKV